MNKKENKKHIYIYIGLSITLIFLLILIALYLINSKNNDEEKNISYTDLIKQINEQAVEKVEMTVGSTSIKVKLKGEEESKNAIIPSTQAFIELIQTKAEEGNEINVEQKQQNIFLKIPSMLFSLLPTLMMVALFVLIYKVQGLGDKGKIYDGEGNVSNVKFEDIAGLEEEKTELIEIVDFLKEPKRFYDMGAKIPKGILLYGKPGTGKTLIAKAIAGEAGVPFISMSGSEFIEMFAGLGASRVRKLFEKARKISPCIVFIDEIDAIGSRRTSQSGAESENNQTLNQLLVEMDGFEKNETIIVLAATNRPEMLDKALLRPGRFDRQITIAPPDIKGREEILKIHSKEKKFSKDVTLKSIAEDTAGFTGAELANILNEAAIIATINKHTEIEQIDIEEAVKKVTVGLQKNSRVVSQKEKNLTAYHEAGHAIVGKFLQTGEELKEISIIPRGPAGGYTMYKTNEDKFYKSKTEMEEKLIGLLGGRAAEKLALDDISTGARNDIQVATQIAKDMVTVYGMSDTLGPISLELEENLTIFGQNIEDIIGEEIKKLIDAAYQKAQIILNKNIDKLHILANLLLKEETITKEQFEKIFID
ncbi:MAG: ATP-dependent zinc metalloprotease FtsH [Clostridia bacterium]|jgi:cell division protease FtsH|nr:ATP-dependent zinc metalloprotease FtsH [Clostridia bacterium]